MGESPIERFGEGWARRKLDMPRRRRELTAYVDRWLQELRDIEPGLVVDVGCGPGDFLAICREFGHQVLGIDAPNGRGGMGDFYLALCREERKRLGVEVDESGLQEGFPRLFNEHNGTVACINARGSIEQAGADCMLGDPHHFHHDCRKLEWNRQTGESFLRTFIGMSAGMLRPGGILLIAANGSRNGDDWYDRTVRTWGQSHGLRLVEFSGPLTHKWVKPDLQADAIPAND